MHKLKPNNPVYKYNIPPFKNQTLSTYQYFFIELNALHFKITACES
ncbi:hypothetical protein PLUTE_b0025 [Pseudoalteromonas luteoviolacea DSM 6061]|nr:hypothetical protein [Pseudoalteromonas luteoviolacea DSM 6061]